MVTLCACARSRYEYQWSGVDATTCDHVVAVLFNAGVVVECSVVLMVQVSCNVSKFISVCTMQLEFGIAMLKNNQVLNY